MDIQKLHDAFHGEFAEKSLMDCRGEDYILWHAAEAGKEFRAGNSHNALILWQNARWLQNGGFSGVKSTRQTRKLATA